MQQWSRSLGVGGVRQLGISSTLWLAGCAGCFVRHQELSSATSPPQVGLQIFAIQPKYRHECVGDSLGFPRVPDPLGWHEVSGLAPTSGVPSSCLPSASHSVLTQPPSPIRPNCTNWRSHDSENYWCWFVGFSGVFTCFPCSSLPTRCSN